MFVPSADPTFPADPRTVIKRILNKIARLLLPLIPAPTPTPKPMAVLLPAMPIATEAVTVEDACRALRSEGRSIREIAKEMRLSYYMARKYVTQ